MDVPSFSNKYEYVIKASSGFTYRHTSKTHDCNITRGGITSAKLARMHRHFGQTGVPSVSFPEGQVISSACWLPQGQSYNETKSLDGRQRSSKFKKTTCIMHLHRWPKTPTLRSLNSTFFIMQLDVERVLHAVDETEMNAKAATKFTILLTESSKPLLLPTPRDYGLADTDEPVKMIIKTGAFFPEKSSLNFCTIEIRQRISSCKTGGLQDYTEFKVAHVLTLIWYGKERKLLVVGRGEGWTFLQYLSCSEFSVTFAKRILSSLSSRKQAQLHMLQGGQTLECSHPSYHHVKSSMNKDCDFVKSLLALQKFELCDVYHYKDPKLCNAGSDSSSGGEDDFEYNMGTRYPNLATLPVKVGVGHGLVKIGLPLNVNCFSKVADLVIASMTNK